MDISEILADRPKVTWEIKFSVFTASNISSNQLIPSEENQSNHIHKWFIHWTKDLVLVSTAIVLQCSSEFPN